MLFGVVVLCVSALAGVFAQTETHLCRNDVFLNPADFGAVTGSPFDPSVLKLPTEDKPSAYPPTDAGTCAYYMGNPSVCCNKDTLTKVVSAFTAAREIIKTQEQYIQEDPISDYVMKMVNVVGDEVCSGVFKNEKLCTKIKDTIATYSKIFSDDVKTIVTAQLQCSESVLAYAEGMVCFACNAEFEKFVDKEAKTIKIASSTCDSIYDACENAVMVSVTKLLNDVNAFVAAIISDLSGSSIPKSALPDAGDLPDMCGGSINNPSSSATCKKFVCDTMLDGLSSLNWLNWKKSMDPTGRKLMAIAREPFIVKDGVDFSTAARGHMEKLHRHLGAHLRKLWLPQERKLAGSASGHNVYTSDGYDAFGVGCANSGVDCGGLPAWAIVLSIVGGTSLIIGGAFVALRRYRKLPGMATESSKPGYNTLA